MARARGIKEIAYVDVGGGGGAAHVGSARGAGVQSMTWFDCAGGGQVIVEAHTGAHRLVPVAHDSSRG